jgi:hypothetical protein
MGIVSGEVDVTASVEFDTGIEAGILHSFQVALSVDLIDNALHFLVSNLG